jgi:hypothetical protein
VAPVLEPPVPVVEPVEPVPLVAVPPPDVLPEVVPPAAPPVVVPVVALGVGVGLGAGLGVTSVAVRGSVLPESTVPQPVPEGQPAERTAASW